MVGKKDSNQIISDLLVYAEKKKDFKVIELVLLLKQELVKSRTETLALSRALYNKIEFLI